MKAPILAGISGLAVAATVTAYQNRPKADAELPRAFVADAHWVLSTQLVWGEGQPQIVQGEARCQQMAIARSQAASVVQSTCHYWGPTP